MFYQIPDSLLSSIIEVSVDKYDRFFISSTVLFELLPDKSIRVLDKFDLNRALFYKDADEIVNGFGIQKSGSIEGFRITEDGYEAFPYFVNQISPSPIEKISVFMDGDRTFLFEGLTGKIYQVEGREINEISQLTLNNNRSTIYSIMGEFWIPNITLGLNQINDIHFPNKQQTAIFDHFKISAYCIDNENNILFGTFKDGIIVVPKSQISSVDLGELNTKINLISLGANDEILFATHDGQFGKIDSEGRLLENYGQLHTSTIEFLEYLKYHDKFILGGLTTSIIDARSNEISNPKMGAMKNLVTVRHGQYIITTNIETYIYNPNDTVYDPFKKTRDIVSTTAHHRIFSGRSYTAAFDSIHSNIYVGTSIGLKLIDSTGTYSLKFKTYDILCRDIMYCKGRIYVASDKNGVLIYENGILIENWTIENRLVSNNTRKLLYNQDYIFINTDKGIQIVDYSGNTFYFLNKSEGLFTNHVIDMVVINDQLIVLNQTGVQKIDLKVLQTNEFVPNIRFNSLKMNGKPIADVFSIGNYDYNENKFEADFGSISLKNDAENAYIYISKFAMLVRTTLTHSDKDFIDFTDEVKSLTLYLTLEKLRFKSAFEFSISAPEDIEVQIPPMLIQPFIENSLVHGLLHKSGQKN